MKYASWARFIVIQLIAAIAMAVGWVLLFFLSYARGWRHGYSTEFEDRIVTVWKWKAIDAIWGNAEDGVVGPPWYNPNESAWKAYLWSAWRNSANNLRWRFSWIGGPFWRRAWKGWYIQAGFKPITGWPVLSAGRQ